jgi:hypothetical protein
MCNRENWVQHFSLLAVTFAFRNCFNVLREMNKNVPSVDRRLSPNTTRCQLNAALLQHSSKGVHSKRALTRETNRVLRRYVDPAHRQQSVVHNLSRPTDLDYYMIQGLWVRHIEQLVLRKFQCSASPYYNSEHIHTPRTPPIWMMPPSDSE